MDSAIITLDDWQKGTGRLVPQDFEHIDKYLFSAVQPTIIDRVERTLPLPRYRIKYDQGVEGACVGFAVSWMMSILNRKFYDARWLYQEAKKVDGWPGEDYEGTSVRAAMDILRTLGHRLKYQRLPLIEPDIQHGILVNRWARTVDEIRTSIANGVPVTMGTNWYSSFTQPQLKGREFWVPETDIGYWQGGHAWCIYGASDRRQAFKMVNNWGSSYPVTYFPYNLVQRLINEYGEATIITDR